MLLTMREVAKRTTLSRTTIQRLVERGQFPAPVKLTEIRVAWTEQAVNDWIAERVAHAG